MANLSMQRLQQRCQQVVGQPQPWRKYFMCEKYEAWYWANVGLQRQWKDIRNKYVEGEEDEE